MVFVQKSVFIKASLNYREFKTNLGYTTWEPENRKTKSCVRITEVKYWNFKASSPSKYRVNEKLYILSPPQTRELTKLIK